MTASVDAPVATPINPKSLATVTPPTDAEVPRIPSSELPEVLSNGFKKPVTTNGHSISGTATNGVVEDPFKLASEYAYTPRKIKVITIGAGFSGLLMAHKFQHRFPEMRDIVEHKIFEARSDVGGTWLVNDYPGVQCDVPAHIYVSISPWHTLDADPLSDFAPRPFPLTLTPNGPGSTPAAPISSPTSSAPSRNGTSTATCTSTPASSTPCGRRPSGSGR